LGALGLGGAGVLLAAQTGRSDDLVWQIDPDKCIACGNCATHCVLDESAVKCVHSHELCGYCELCFAYFDPKMPGRTTAAENQRCPTGAIERTFVADPRYKDRYEYNIIEELCIGCGKCVEGCTERMGGSGNGSVYLQVKHDRCLGCNECSIAVACPSRAFVRVPAHKPYLLRPRRSEA
jgi:electron transport complex protein RnfB